MEDSLYRFLRIYNSLPLSVKKIIGKIYNLIPSRIRYGDFYNEYMKRIQAFKTLEGEDEVFAAQEQLLITHVNKAIKSVPFYNRYDEISGINEFRKLPVINKQIITAQKKEFINVEKRNLGIKTNTGGSSGNPMEFFIEKNVSRPKEKAHFDWYWGQFDYKPGNKILMVRGMPLSNNRLFEYRTIDNILSVSCYNINETNIGKVAKKINSFGPSIVYGYPSSLKNLISLLISTGHELNLNIKAVFLGSEYLSDFDRKFFKNFFKTYIVNWYGHTERLVHGGNCPICNEYHFYPFYGFLELLDENDNAVTVPGMEGRIVATSFDNEVMPFIRYDTGDFGVLSEKRSCKCGFTGLTLKSILGRGQDVIILSDGTRVSLTAFIFGQHLKSFNKIREFQVVQHEIGKIELKIVKNNFFNKKDEENTRNALLKSINNKLQIVFNYVETIPKTTRGKNIFFVSHI